MSNLLSVLYCVIYIYIYRFRFGTMLVKTDNVLLKKLRQVLSFDIKYSFHSAFEP